MPRFQPNSGIKSRHVHSRNEQPRPIGGAGQNARVAQPDKTGDFSSDLSGYATRPRGPQEQSAPPRRVPAQTATRHVATFAATFGGPVLLAPAMNPKMWAHPACRANVEVLRSRGVRFVGPESGRVACGEDGVGRMAEPGTIFETIRLALDAAE